jgi:hypothetical protein
VNSELKFLPFAKGTIRLVRLRVDSMLAFTALLVLLTSGCSGPEGPMRIPVSGRVMLDGQPLTAGVVRFIPAEGVTGPGAATQVTNGEFCFSDDDGPIAASHRVEIEATDFQGFAIDDEAAFAAHAQKTGRSPMASNPIPPIYNRASTLAALVTDAEDQKFEFVLSSGLRHVVSH